MSRNSPLLDSLQRAVLHRAQAGMTIFNLDEPLPPSAYASDLFSNDYLSLSTDRSLRDIFLQRIQAAAPGRLLGSTGSRLATGNSAESNALEKAFKDFFGAPSALLFPSGFNANMAFCATVPQNTDVIIYDEMIHPCCREGMRLSSRPSYRFAHNSVASFEECLVSVLRNYPQIMRGNSTVFVLMESLYSMEGDFSPLTEIVGLVESLVPAGNSHIVVDEAHTSGICGPNGTGYVSYLGLNEHVHTKIHTFGKAWGFHGAVVLTSPIIRDYLINFAKSFIFSTSIPYADIYALESCLGIIQGIRGHELRKRLNHLSRYARKTLFIALRKVPETILTLGAMPDVMDASISSCDRGLCSPIIPVFTPHARRLTDYLLQRGYAAAAVTYPIVRQPRIRVTVHAGNTEEEIDALVNHIVAWANSAIFSAGTPYTTEMRARL
ncbi:8-amino-7-oxononanoate synthase [Chiua virens]|nr:8-amino-7-oxononanoate synthase [Chiua virens]